MVHVVLQVAGKAGAGLGGEQAAQDAEGQGQQREDHQPEPQGADVIHIPGLDAVVHQVRHIIGDEHFHDHFHDHAQGRQHRQEFILSDASRQFFYHKT